MKDDVLTILKKFWFVILVGCIFVAMAIYFAWDTNKDKLSAKSVDGKDVIFSLDEENYTADEYYKTLFNATSNDTKTGIQLVYSLMEREVIDQSVKATDKIKDQAEKNFKSSETYYKNLYGDNYETTIGSQLKQLGYGGIDDYEQYFVDVLKKEKFISNYVKAHKELFDEVYNQESPRVIAHILVSCADPSNPTATEKAKMAKVEKALAGGASFEKVAKKYSDDTATSSKGGSLGVQLKSGSLQDAFKKAAWGLSEGATTTEWVKTTYGYHMIKVITTSKKEMLSNSDYWTSVVSAVTDHYPNLSKQIVWKKAEKLGVKVKKSISDELKTYINGTN